MTTTIIKNRTGLCAATPQEAPYILICNEHHWAHGCGSRTEAAELYKLPTEWCEDCLFDEMIAEGDL